MSTADITQLLQRWKQGERGMDDALAAAVYPVLREVAGHVLLGHGGSTLTLRATDLANEAYLRLERQRTVDWQNRAHFFAIAATVVRRVLVDYLRERGAEKRGGGLLRIQIEDIEPGIVGVRDEPVAWLAVDEALSELQRTDPASARVVELRVFGGLKIEEIAEVCDSSTATVGRQWRFARAWLADRLEPPG